jgi:transposase-like protein
MHTATAKIFLRKVLRTHTGERTVFSINSARKIGYINMQKNGIRYLYQI